MRKLRTLDEVEEEYVRKNPEEMGCFCIPSTIVFFLLAIL